MSTNITATHLFGQLLIRKDALNSLRDWCESEGVWLGESSIIEGDGLIESRDPDYWALRDLACWGEGSGHAWEDVCKYVVPHLEGGANVVLVWDGGWLPEGYRIENGSIRKMDLRFEFDEIGGGE